MKLVFSLLLLSLNIYSVEHTFLNICINNTNYTASTQHTIKMIKKNYNTENCNDIYKKISENKSLTLMDSVYNLYAISKLENIENLTLIADLPNNSTQKLDLKYIIKLKNLKSLNLSFYKLEDYKQLNQLAPLESLTLLSPTLSFYNPSNYDLSNNIHINTLLYESKNLLGLKYLTFSGYNIKHVDSFSKLKDIKRLFLADNNFNNITGIKDLKNIFQLDLMNNPLDEYFKKINYKGGYLILNKEDINSLQTLIKKHENIIKEALKKTTYN